MKVLILGGEGMLGHSLYSNLEAKFEVKALVKSKEKALLVNNHFNPKDLLDGVDLEKEEEIEQLILDYSPNVVLNAIGIIKQKNVEDLVISSIKLNSLLPHILSQLSLKLDFKLICFSTDCVFSGQKGLYKETDTPDPVDIYGYTKFLGEQIKEGLVLRTSFIGLELESKYGIIEWYLDQGSEISGYSGAIYSGLLTSEVSRLIEKILTEHLSLSGLWNVSSDPINKFKLLSCLNKLLDNRIPIKSLDEPKIDRSLDSSKFRKQINYCPPSWDESLEEIAKEIKLRESK